MVCLWGNAQLSCVYISCTACYCGSLLLVLLALRAVTSTGYLVSQVAGRLVVSCMSCTKDLQLCDICAMNLAGNTCNDDDDGVPNTT
jgi:hypothetical protein